MDSKNMNNSDINKINNINTVMVNENITLSPPSTVNNNIVIYTVLSLGSALLFES